ncbi:MAG: HigA family addiction module antidote protein [Lachnospiraceae bacterium]|nr:HigA family addiction module antidote protein [Lachnospiraceae bacterium]
METRRTGISRDLLIHPGETIADILEERGISQAELAILTGVSPAYVCNVISGKKDISSKFALSLEYALDVPKSFWLNLQANYDAEVLDYYAAESITEEERVAKQALGGLVTDLEMRGLIPKSEQEEETILSLRKYLQISNLSNLKKITRQGAMREPSPFDNPYLEGAQLRMHEIRKGV